MGKAPTYRMKSRMIIVLICMIAIGFGIVLLNLFRLQVIDGDKWQSYALSQQLRSSKISANRGTIYDANGKILAKSASVWSVIVAPAEVKTQTQENAIADGLSKILEIDGAKILKKLQNKESYHEIIKTKIEQPVADEIYAFIAENDVPGIHLVEDTKRYYPYGNFAANVLGFTDYDNKGAYGLESYYEKVLGGVPGRVVSLKNAAGGNGNLCYRGRFSVWYGCQFHFYRRFSGDEPAGCLYGRRTVRGIPDQNAGKSGAAANPRSLFNRVGKEVRFRSFFESVPYPYHLPGRGPLDLGRRIWGTV